MQKINWLVKIVVILVATVSTPGWGDSQSQRVKVGWTILPFQSLSLDIQSSNSHAFDIGKPTVEELSRRYGEEKGIITLTVRSNIPWVVNVRTDNNNLEMKVEGEDSNPLSDFLLKRSEEDTYIPISQREKILIREEPCMKEIRVHYRILIDEEIRQAGNHGVVIIYTIAPA